jgi:hypothetical protein
MGRASRRKRQRRSSSHRQNTQAAGKVLAPNFDRTAVQAVRDAFATVTSAHASPEDLPELIEEIAGDRGRQGLVAYTLLSQFIAGSARELADARGQTLQAVLDSVTADLKTAGPEDRAALDSALFTVRTYAEMLDDLRPPDTVTADLDHNLAPGPTSRSYLIALTQIAHRMIAARCAETGEDVASCLQRGSLPAAEAHGNAIDADALEDYVGAIIGDRLAVEPLLLKMAAEALRQRTVGLPDEDAAEFRELGGSDQIEDLAGFAWDDMDAEDQRLLAITLLESVFVDPGGETVADRVRLVWRF